MSMTKALRKKLQAMTREQKAAELKRLKGLEATEKNFAVRSSLGERIRMVEASILLDELTTTGG